MPAFLSSRSRPSSSDNVSTKKGLFPVLRPWRSDPQVRTVAKVTISLDCISVCQLIHIQRSSRTSIELTTPPPPYQSRPASIVSRRPSYDDDTPIVTIDAASFDGGGVRGVAAAKIHDHRALGIS